jgi:hypothetical protein
MTTRRRFALSVSILIALTLAVSCGQKEEAAEDTSGHDIKVAGFADPADSLILELTGIDSMTVLDVLKKDHDVKFMTSLKGSFVIRIDSIANREGYFWVYSVNGVMGDVACDKYVTSKGDHVRWHYRMTGDLQM